jgi:hypothetical protein
MQKQTNEEFIIYGFANYGYTTQRWVIERVQQYSILRQYYSQKSQSI